jgi:uncharacterized UPF0146 family protein
MDKGTVALTGTPKDIFTSEKAHLIGIGIPKATKLYQHLKKAGVDLQAVPVTPEQAATLLREVLKHA